MERQWATLFMPPALPVKSGLPKMETSTRTCQPTGSRQPIPSHRHSPRKNPVHSTSSILQRLRHKCVTPEDERPGIIKWLRQLLLAPISWWPSPIGAVFTTTGAGCRLPLRSRSKSRYLSYNAAHQCSESWPHSVCRRQHLCMIDLACLIACGCIGDQAQS